MRVLLLSMCSLVLSASSVAASFDYGLSAIEVVKDTYVFKGKNEDFNKENGGNIVNTGFIVTDAGVVVIDSGPSKRYAEQQQAAIAKVTDKPVIKVFLTHHHPDHFFGNQVYKDKELLALPKTIYSMHQEGGLFADNMYRLVGDWMRGTSSTPANKVIATKAMEVGGHDLELIQLNGHSVSDLAIFDRTTGVLFAGDLVFNNRALTTPHAYIGNWQAALAYLKKVPFKVLVPGHGEIAGSTAPIDQTSDYLNWLITLLKEGAEQGLDMNELMRTRIPARFEHIALAKEELIRSVTHLYPRIEQGLLQPVSQ